MEFYLELSDKFEYLRLQKDGAWKKIQKGEKLSESDFTSSHVFDLIRIQGRKTRAVVEDKEVYHGHDHFYHHVMVERSSFPKTPSKDQLQSVIRQGDDNVTNSLILNVYGFFELRDYHTMEINTDDPTMVFRYETFGAENNYVGEESADDERYINDLYTTFLEGWLSHLKNGMTNRYFATESKRSEETILAEIDSMKSHWNEESE